MAPLWLEGVFIAPVDIPNFANRQLESNDPTRLGRPHILDAASMGKIVRLIAILVCDKVRKRNTFYKAARIKPQARQGDNPSRLWLWFRMQAIAARRGDFQGYFG